MGSSKGNKQSTATSQTQTYQADPRVQASGELAMNQAVGAAQQPFQMPTAPVAPFNPFQQQAFNQVQGAQGMTDPYFAQARNYIDQSASPLTGGTISQYYNPMADNVTAQLKNIFGQQNRQATGSATQAAGGVGADRIGVAQANLANQQTLGAGQVYANLYQQAVQNAQADAARQQSAGYAYGQLGPAAQAANLQATSALGGAGNQQQQQQQQQLNAPYQNILAQIAYPFQTSQFLAGITGGLAPAFGGTTSGVGNSQTTLPTPSPLNQILGVGTSAAGLAGGLKGSGSGTSNLGAGSTFDSGSGPIDVGGAPFTNTFFKRGGSVRFADGGDTSDIAKLLASTQARVGSMGPPPPNPMLYQGSRPMGPFDRPSVQQAPPFQLSGSGSPMTLDQYYQANGGSGPVAWDRAAAPPQDGLTPLQRLMGNRFDPPPAMQPPPEPQRKPNQTASEAQQDYNNIGARRGGVIYRATGGSADDEDSGGEGTPPLPGITIPKTGGMSPIPYTPLRGGSGQFHNNLNLNPPQQQSSGGGKGSGVSDALKLATAVIPFLARGGSVGPFDHGQGFDDGGDVDFPFETGSAAPEDESWSPEPMQGMDAPMGNTNPHWSMDDLNQKAKDYYGPTFNKVADAVASPFRGTSTSPQIADKTPPTDPQIDIPYETAGMGQAEAPPVNPFGPNEEIPLPRGNPRTVGGVKSTMANELSRSGGNSMLIGGINMATRDESNFDPHNITRNDQHNPRFAGTDAMHAHGLFQEGGDEWNAYKTWLKQNHPDAPWDDEKLQTQFLAENLKENYPQVWKGMNDAKTPGEAAAIFTRGYLKPAAGPMANRMSRYLAGSGNEGDDTVELSGRERNPFAANRDMSTGDYLRSPDRPYSTPKEQMDWGQKLARSPWMSLVKAGAAMATTTGPVGSAIGKGIAAGAGSLENQRKEIRSEQDQNAKADHLFQQAQVHLDRYQRMTPGEQETAHYHREIADRTKYQPVNMEVMNDKGEPEVVSARFNPKTGIYEDQEGNPLKGRLIARQTGAESATSRSNHALSAAKDDPAYAGDQIGTINKHRVLNGLPPLGPSQVGTTKETAIPDPGETGRKKGMWYIVNGVPKQWL